jgi:hypothetical protein
MTKLLYYLRNDQKRKNLIKIGFFAFLGIAILSWIQTCNIKNEALARLERTNQQVIYWKDQSGNAHATLKKVQREKSQIKKEVDSIAAVLKIKPKTITSYIEADAKVDTIIKPEYTTTTIHDTVRIDGGFRIDTILAYKVDYQDSVWLSIKGTVPSKDGLKVTLQAKISVTEFWQRKWFLGKKNHYIDITTDNPYITLSNAKSLHLRPSPRFRVRPGIGVGVTYDPISRTYTPGLQAGVYIFFSR